MAAVIGIMGNVPQLTTMLRAQSAGGQSVLGWALGAVTNLTLLAVNGLGYHAMVLMIGNTISLVADLAAIALILRFRDPHGEADAAEATSTQGAVAEMHTQEFAVLRDVVLAEHHRRTGRPVLAI